MLDESLTHVPGFRVAAIDAGIRAHFGKTPQPDLTLITAEGPCTAAGVFTTNLVKAAPVLLDMARVQANPDGIRAVMVNTASANACTGDEGLRNAEQSAVWAAQALGVPAESVLVMSTGVIGTQLPMPVIQAGIPAVVAALRPDGWRDAAAGIMTTDTRPKFAAVRENGVTVMGIAKGAGMIAPNMATLLSVVVTDAAIPAPLLQAALRQAADRTFNCVVVDGDMSTNDTLIALANGASGQHYDADRMRHFQPLLDEVCTALARAIVKDGEGVTKFITLKITGARTVAEAKQIGNTIGTSPLVKTAFYGGDPNWGRILAAAGRAGVALDQWALSLWYNDLHLVERGTPLNYDEARAKLIAGLPEIDVRLDLGAGEAEATVWTCDLSHDYVSINGHYRT